MSVTLEKIDMLMERANISYKEAKEALESSNGDMVEALIYLEGNEKITNNKEKKYKREERQKTAKEDFKKAAKKFHRTKLNISKKGETVVNLPITLVILLFLVTLPVSLLLVFIPFVAGYKVKIVKSDNSELYVKDVIKNCESKVKETFSDDEVNEEEL